MRQNLEIQERLALVTSEEAHKRSSRVIDALAYSVNFEKALSHKIALIQSTLDYVSLQLHSTHQRRLLTRLEHNVFATASLAFEEGPAYGFSPKDCYQVAGAFLVDGVSKALNMVLPPSFIGERWPNHSHDNILKKLGSSGANLASYNEFLPWDNTQNINDFLDCFSANEPRLKPGNAARKLHYLCQLCVYTSTPKSPDDYPLSILVTPDEFFSLSTMWARKPLLWARHAIVTQSGKIIASKVHEDSEIAYRRDLGLLADLHLNMAKLIAENRIIRTSHHF